MSYSRCDKLKNPQLFTSHGSKFDAKWHLPVSKKFSNRTLNNEHVYIMCQVISWAWANIVVAYFRFKSVSPLFKTMQSRPETRISKFYMKFCGQVTLYPCIVNLNIFFWLIQYGRHTQRHLSLIVFSRILPDSVFLENYNSFQQEFFWEIVLLNYDTMHKKRINIVLLFAIILSLT